MKEFLAVALLFISSFSFGQAFSLKDNFARLEVALITKDSLALKLVLHQDLSYGHSNGWIETKQEVIDHLFNGKMAYVKIKSGEVNWQADNYSAVARYDTDITYLLNEKEGKIKMHIVQVWVNTKNGWRLLARQSIKI